MKSLWIGVVCFAAGALSLAAFREVRTPAVVRADSQPDTSKLERFMRRYYAWPTESIVMSLSPFKPSTMPGFFEATVVAFPKKGAGDRINQDIYVSGDGRFMLENAPLRLDADPFRETREQIDLRNHPGFGSVVPRVTIVEFGDLQCSYCKAVVNVLRTDIPRDYGREVRVIFKDYPLFEIHPWAWDAAASGRCVFKQKPEAFWEYHDWAYEQQGKLNPEQFKRAAASFVAGKHLDTAKYTACLADPDTRAEIERSLQEGRALKVTGTPAFFINGRKVEGSMAYSTMRQYIQSELEYLGGK